LALETLLAAVSPDIDEPVFIGEQAVRSKAEPRTPPRTPLRTIALIVLMAGSENVAGSGRDRFRVSDAKGRMLMMSPDQVGVWRLSQGLPAPVRV
jgi:hypothetical protein